MKFQYGVFFLLMAAFIAFATAIAHMSCIYLGPECYALQMAPSQIIESAKNGTYLAPVGTTLVSIIFAVLGLYALSGAGIVRRLPLLTFALYSIAILCIVRGILPVQLWMRHPEKVSFAVLTAGIVWLIAGLLFLFGYRNVRNNVNARVSVAG